MEQNPNLSPAQVSNIETQQTVSPVRTATGDAIVGGVGVAAEQVAANVADLATSLIPVIASALATAISQSIAALVPVVITAAGGASTPSQTQAKPERLKQFPIRGRDRGFSFASRRIDSPRPLISRRVKIQREEKRNHELLENLRIDLWVKPSPSSSTTPNHQDRARVIL